MSKNSEQKYSQEDFIISEKTLYNKILDYTEQPEIQSQLSEAYYIWLNNPDIITDYIDEKDLDDETFTKFLDWFIHDFKLINNQMRVIESFNLQTETLSDIEQLIINDWIESNCSFYEITKIEKNKSCSIKDILTNKKYNIIDKNASNQLTVSDIIYARPIKTGELYYFSGVISVFPKILRQRITETFNDEFEEYKKQFGKTQKPSAFLKDWSYIIFKKMEDLLNHPKYLNPDGDEFVIAKSNYKIKNHKVLLKKLRELANLREISDSSSEINLFLVEDSNVSSYLEIDKDNLTIECNSKNKLDVLKNEIEELLADYIKHEKDIIRNLDSFVDIETKKTKKHLNQYEESLDKYYDEWIRKPLDKLDGKSPLEAITSDKYRNKIENILNELESLYEDAKKHGEPFYEVNIIREKLLNLSSKDFT